MHKRRIAGSMVAAVAIAVGVLTQAAPALAVGFSGADASAFVADVNALRAAHGVPGLGVSPALVSMADGWSAHLASAGSLSHNPDLAAQAPAGWRLLGENVGVGADVASLQAAFAASPEHYANMVDPRFREIGVSVYVTSQGYLWVTEDYMEPPPGAVVPPPPPPSPSTPAPAPTPSVGPAAPQTPSVPLTRVAGPDRVATAVAASQSAFPTGGAAGAVVLADDQSYPDALVGGPLAAHLGGPLLLTGPDALDPRAQGEISRVLPPGGTVFLLGGAAALSASVEESVTALGYLPVRVAGADRYATAAAVASELGDPATVLEASGDGFADALAAGPAAVARGAAILLTAGSSQAPETAGYLEDHPGDTRIAVGGPAAAADPQASRSFVGPDRYSTAAMTALAYFPAPSTIGMATGLDYPDGLVAGPYTAARGGPLLLVPSSGPLPTSVSGYLASLGHPVQSVFAYGGSSALGDGVVAAVQGDIRAG